MIKYFGARYFGGTSANYFTSITNNLQNNVVVYPTGVSATASIGTVNFSTDCIFAVTGVSATGSVNSVQVVPVCNVFVTGVSATGAVGTVT